MALTISAIATVIILASIRRDINRDITKRREEVFDMGCKKRGGGKKK